MQYDDEMSIRAQQNTNKLKKPKPKSNEHKQKRRSWSNIKLKKGNNNA